MNEQRDVGRVRTVRRFALCAALALLAASALAREPYLPADDSVVLERLPASGLRDAALERLRLERDRAPMDPGPAAALAFELVARARVSGDPRFLGHAQAALAPWWNAARPPAEVLLLRATIAQNRHDFDAALADLAQLTEREPRNARAWLTRAVVLTVVGEPRQALASCARLRRIAPGLVRDACLALAWSLMGHDAKAYRVLAESLRRAAPETPGRAWATGLLGEIALMRGEHATAASHLLDALAMDPRDRYLRNALSDSYLAQGDAQRALALLDAADESDGSLLRRALALRALGRHGADALAARLARRYDVLNARGDTVHLGEAARFELAVRGNAARALVLATRNFSNQREPRDAIVLLESALAMARPHAAAPVRRWRDATGVRDVRVERLLFALGGGGT